MRLSKILRYSALILFVGAFSSGIFLYGKRFLYEEKEKKILMENKYEDAGYTKIPYIKIPSISLTKMVESYLNKDNINNYGVGIWNEEKDIDRINHLVLAGHNVKNAFGPLIRVQKGEEIYLYHKDKKDVYVITEIKEIGVTEMEYLKNRGEKELSLITCTKDDQKRLWVHAKQKRD